MARKTPPVAVQVVPPKLPSIAFLKGRLIDFDTGSPNPEAQHKAWLTEKIRMAAKNSMYRVRLVGYASKKGDENANESLSYNRITAVAKHLESIDPKARDRIETFRAVGERAYAADEKDDSADWRAVEVHIFIGDIPPPPPPPGVTPIPRTRPVLPGGERFTKWEVASPGGAYVATGVGGGFNVFFIKNVKQNEMRGYLQPVLGIGAGLGVSGLKPVWSAIQNIIGGWQYADPDFESITTKVAVTWDEIESCLVRVSGASAGLVKGAGMAVITFIPAKVWQYNNNDVPLNLSLPGDGVLFQFTTAGENWQIGANASMAVGPLVKVA